MKSSNIFQYHLNDYIYYVFKYSWKIILSVHSSTLNAKWLISLLYKTMDFCLFQFKWFTICINFRQLKLMNPANFKFHPFVWVRTHRLNVIIGVNWDYLDQMGFHLKCRLEYCCQKRIVKRKNKYRVTRIVNFIHSFFTPFHVSINFPKSII